MQIHKNQTTSDPSPLNLITNQRQILNELDANFFTL